MTTLVVGPFPPPVHGQSLATAALVEALRQRGIGLETVDTSEGVGGGAPKTAASKIASHVAAVLRAGSGSGPVYLSTNSGAGMWLSAAVAGAARARGRQLLIHHHSYDHVRRRRSRGAALARAAGASAIHIVLGEAMGESLKAHTPEVNTVFVLNNAGLIDQSLLSLPVHSGSEIVLGHLSNLTAQKGVTEVVGLAIAARQSGRAVRLVLAGPAADSAAKAAIARAEQTLGQDFTYRGAVFGEQKARFFAEVTHFVFPTRYRNEASPLVLFEAMAAGVTCIATARGCIAGDLGTGGGFAFAEDDFTAQALALLETCTDIEPASVAARHRFRQLLREHDAQLTALAAILAQDSVKYSAYAPR